MRSMRRLSSILILAFALVVGFAAAARSQVCCHCMYCEDKDFCFQGPSISPDLCDTSCNDLTCDGGEVVDSPCTGCDEVFQINQRVTPVLGPQALVFTVLAVALAGSLRLIRRRSTR